MTLDQTRQLGIEFERRVQTMIPETESATKLDTDTIYSFLNQYQDKYVHDLYKMLDSIPDSTKPFQYADTILRGLISTYSVSLQKTETNIHNISLPSDFGLYADSTTSVDNSYKFKNREDAAGVLHNVTVSSNKLRNYLIKPHDRMRILRTPIIGFDGKNSMILICDRYTKPTGFTMTYYKIPNYMNLFTSTPCELSMDAFDDLVTGAVDMYVQYVAGAEARKRQMAEEQRRNQRANREEQ